MLSKYSAIGILVLIVLSSLMVALPTKVSADTSYYYTYLPSAANSTHWTVYPRYASTVVPAYGIQVAGDGYSEDVYVSSTGVLQYYETNDFTYPTYNDDNESDGYIQDLPLDNATILSVNVVASFYSYNPQTVLYYSIDDKSSWNYSSTIPAGGGGFFPMNAVTWNITSLEEWTPAMLNTTDFWVKAKFTPSGGIHYYLDYLGIVVTWSVEMPGGDESPFWGPSTEGGAEIDLDIIYTGEGIVGVLGFVGFVGMIAAPFIGVYAARNSSDSRIGIFVKTLCLFMVFLTFLMVSIQL